MVVDTSALLAVLFEEPESSALLSALADSSIRTISSVTLLETSLVLAARKGEAAWQDLAELLDELSIEVVPFTSEHMEAARHAWLRFGKGRHPASLNILDCCSYALAENSRQPLAFVGDDFRQTDIASAVSPPGTKA